MRSYSVLAHALTVEQLKQSLKTDDVHGRAKTEIVERLRVHGLNQLKEEAPVAWPIKLLGQFKSVLILILLIAAAMAGIMGEWTEASAILAIVILNGVIGFFQEARAEKAIASLKQLAAPQARVIRDGVEQVISAAELVPGDLIQVEAGDFVPADARLILYDCLQSQGETSRCPLIQFRPMPSPWSS